MEYSQIGTGYTRGPKPHVAALQLKQKPNGWYKVFVDGYPANKKKKLRAQEGHVFTVQKKGNIYYWYDVNGSLFMLDENKHHVSYQVAHGLSPCKIRPMIDTWNVPETLKNGPLPCTRFQSALDSHLFLDKKQGRFDMNKCILPYKEGDWQFRTQFDKEGRMYLDYEYIL